MHGEGPLALREVQRLVERKTDVLELEYDQGGAQQCLVHQTRVDADCAYF